MSKVVFTFYLGVGNILVQYLLYHNLLLVDSFIVLNFSFKEPNVYVTFSAFFSYGVAGFIFVEILIITCISSVVTVFCTSLLLSYLYCN
jgi:hypothetical protein